MANILKPKRRTADGTAPTTGNLQDGEFAINTFARAIYQRVGSNVIMVANYFSGAWADLSGKPTTLAGYGITDGIPNVYATSGTIPGSADLDTYTTPGFYHQDSNANAASGANYPIPYAGMLQVYAANNMVYQTYQRYNIGARWHRSCYAGTWSGWATEWNSAIWTGPDVQVVAGPGLTGGGALAASRTITLGTPGTLSGSTGNTVTSTSHTHALSSNLSAWDAIAPSAKMGIGGGLVGHAINWELGAGGTRFRFTTSAGYTYLQAGDPSGDDSGGKMRLSGWVGSQLDELRIDALSVNVNGAAVHTTETFNPVAIIAVAGNGLTGGGAINANHTFTLGTPSTVTGTSTNATTTTSHTHALNIDSRYVPFNVVTVHTSTTLSATHLNSVVEKSNTGTYTYTLGTGLGAPGSTIVILNSGTSGNVTIARNGTALLRNGTDADVVVAPGSVVRLYRSATADRWVC